MSQFDYLSLATLSDNFQNLNAFSVFDPSNVRVYRQALYDSVLYPTAGGLAFALFSVPKGQGAGVTGTTAPGAVAGTAKTIDDTNMQLAGQMPTGLMQLVTSIELEFIPGSVSTANTYTPQTPYSFVAVPTAQVPISAGAVNDFNAVTQSGVVTLVINQITVVQENGLFRFPCRNRRGMGEAALASNSATTSSLAMASPYADGDPYDLPAPIRIAPNVAFGLTVSYNAVVATPTGFNGRLRAWLNGLQFQNV